MCNANAKLLGAALKMGSVCCVLNTCAKLLECNFSSTFIYGIFFWLICCFDLGVRDVLNQTGNSAIRYESTLPRPESEMNKNRRASSLELILSPMVESTLQRK